MRRMRYLPAPATTGDGVVSDAVSANYDLTNNQNHNGSGPTASASTLYSGREGQIDRLPKYRTHVSEEKNRTHGLILGETF